MAKHWIIPSDCQDRCYPKVKKYELVREENLAHHWWECKSETIENNKADFKSLKIKLPYDPHLSVDPKEMNPCLKGLCPLLCLWWLLHNSQGGNQMLINKKAGRENCVCMHIHKHKMEYSTFKKRIQCQMWHCG